MSIHITSHLKKEYWLRRVNPDAPGVPFPPRADYYVAPPCADPCGQFQLLTQEAFMCENEPSAHEINSRYMSLRPVYEAQERETVAEDGTRKTQTEWVVTGFDPVETVRFGLQKRNNLSKAAFMAGNGFWVCHEDREHDLAEKLNSWKDSACLDMAWMELVQSCFLTGDGAIYLYVSGGRLRYQVFSYLKGDVLFPDFDADRNFVLYRLYTLRGRRAVDIYSSCRVQTWIEGDKDDERDKSWVARFGGWFRKGQDLASTKMSEDGWRCVADSPVQTPDGMNPVTYWRVRDIPSGISQQDICALEKASSFVADGVKSASQPILFLKATSIETLPEQDSTGQRIGVKGAVDEIAAADAKFLTPPNLSDIATIDIATKKESILQSTMSVDITPEIFRSTDPSSAAIKLLFTDTIIWCKNEFTQFYPGLADMVEVFKALVAKLEGDGRYATMRTSCGCDFWVPQNETEVLKRELDQVAYRVKSRKAAMSDIGNAHIEDYEQILKEWREELDLKARVPAEAKAEVEQKYGEPQETIEVKEEETTRPAPGIDNQAKGKSITE